MAVGVASSNEGMWFAEGVGIACAVVCVVAVLVGGVSWWSRRVLPDWKEPGERYRAGKQKS